MKNIFVVIIAFGVISTQSCNTKSKNPNSITTSKDTSKPVENKIMIPNTVCYSGVVGKDTVFLKTEIFPNVVTGNLVYKFHEKDSNKGDIDGVLRNDTLVADYKFFSEGQSSVRQVTFLIKDSTAIEGYAPMEEKEGKCFSKIGMK